MADAQLAGVVAHLRAAPAEPTLERAQALLSRLETEAWQAQHISPLIEEIEQMTQGLQATAEGNQRCLARLKALPPVAGNRIPAGF